MSDLTESNYNNDDGATSLDNDNIKNSAVLAQEQLGQYLDLVESVIMKRVGDRAEVFLDDYGENEKIARDDRGDEEISRRSEDE